MMAWWKAKGGDIYIKSYISDGRMVKGKRGGRLNKELDVRWSHGGRQTGGKFK